MGSMIGFGLGVLVGALCSFAGGRRYERFHRASVIAAMHVGEAREAGRGVGRSIVGFVALLVVGALFLWAGR